MQNEDLGASPDGDRATHEPSPDGLGHSVSVPNAGRFRKRPIVIEAYCFDQRHDNYRPDWFSDAVSSRRIITYPDRAFVDTLEGLMSVSLGDWVIRGVEGEIYPCKSSIFLATYEPCDSDASLAEDPLAGLSGEAVAARAEGIAQPIEKVHP